MFPPGSVLALFQRDAILLSFTDPNKAADFA
jgi:hypothetical protein